MNENELITALLNCDTSKFQGRTIGQMMAVIKTRANGNAHRLEHELKALGHQAGRPIHGQAVRGRA